MVMTEEEFLGFLTPERKQFMLGCVKGGLSDYSNPAYYGAAARVDHTASVISAIRNCHIVARARRASVDFPDVKITEKRGRVLFTIADTVRVAFKKLDGRHRPSNIPTGQTLAFLGQRLSPQDSLPGLEAVPQLTNVVAGYAQDPADMSFQVHVTCPIDGANYWEMNMSGAEVYDFFGASAAPHAADAAPTNAVIKRRHARLRIVSQEEGKATSAEATNTTENNADGTKE